MRRVRNIKEIAAMTIDKEGERGKGNGGRSTFGGFFGDFLEEGP
jgi:hypothetical protein